MNINYSIAEFKVKRPGVDWEDCEIVETIYSTTRALADEHARKLAALHNAQVRWNWKGGNNGHYTGGEQ